MSVAEVLAMQKKVTGKLISAIAMLLIAAIMLGTSSYAWVIMSTAPEVSKVTTTAGANGYLEIALMGTNTTGTGTYVMSHPSADEGKSVANRSVPNTVSNQYCEVLSVFVLGLVKLILSGFVPYFVPSGKKSFRQSNRLLLSGQPLLC